jgi:Ribbon-helix-helix domain
MRSTKRWNVAVSRSTDGMLREYLAKDGMRKGDLSRFVENAVCRHIMKLTDEQVERAKDANSNLGEDDDLSDIVKEVVIESASDD